MKNITRTLAAVVILLGLTPVADARDRQADLAVRYFRFDRGNPQGVFVHVVNYGALNAAPSTLRLTVRVINGTPVGRTTDVGLPVIAGGDDIWVFVDASAILPAAVGLISTTFRADADATAAIAESNETNNRLWHNL